MILWVAGSSPVELKDLPRRKAQETARLSGVSADLQAAKANQELANQRVKGFEEDAKALREKIQQLKTTQMGLKSNKEYQQYSIQIDLVSHDLEATENNQLAAMDELPSAEARIADAQAKFDQEAGGVKAFCDEIDERIAAVTAELAEAQKERAEKAKLRSRTTAFATAAILSSRRACRSSSTTMRGSSPARCAAASCIAIFDNFS